MEGREGGGIGVPSLPAAQPRYDPQKGRSSRVQPLARSSILSFSIGAIRCARSGMRLVRMVLGDTLL